MLISTVGTLIGTLLATEAGAWMPYISRWLVRSARLPEGLDEGMRSRWSEKIEADLANFEDRPLGGLLFALRLRRRRGRRLATERLLHETFGECPSSAPKPEDETSAGTIWVKPSPDRGHFTYEFSSRPFGEERD